MKNVLILLFVIFIAGTAYSAWSQTTEINVPIPQNNPTNYSNQNQIASSASALKVIAENLDTPWAIALLPDGNLLVTERLGKVLLIDKEGQIKPKVISQLRSVKEIGEGGLLGIVLHPHFESNKFVYLYYTYSQSGNDTLNRVVRMTYTGSELINETTIVDKIPGASNHNGGRIKFGPDSFLYIGTGDAQEPSQAQDKSTLGGKILRVTDTGKAAPGNLLGNQVYSYGHRNVQGLAFSQDGTLWATEHGRSGAQSGFDELNKIENGKNYGWPEIQGNETKEGMVTPVYNSGPSTTWAPSGAAFIESSLFFSGLRGQSLYEVEIKNDKVSTFKEHFKDTYGRIREVVFDADGLLYFTTSNNDGRGVPQSNDDKIIRVNPAKI